MADAPPLLFADAASWRAWLVENHLTSTGVRVLRARSGSPLTTVGYDDAVRQALCFGWIDGTVRPHDDDAVSIWFTPRRSRSGWAATNKARIVELEASGEMTEAGRRVIEAARADGTWELLDGPEAGIEPPELTVALDAVPAARAHWDAFPRSARKLGLTHIATAVRPETRAQRIAKIVAAAAEGIRP